MAKDKSGGLLPTLGGVFCFFVVFLRCMAMLGASSFHISMLILPSLWLLLGLCLMTKKKNWLTTVGMLPVVLLTVQSAWQALPMTSVEAFLNTLLCITLPAAGFVVLFVFMLLSCLHTGWKMRRELWFLPILLVLPGCVWQYAATLPWAQFGVVACVTFWVKPTGK